MRASTSCKFMKRDEARNENLELQENLMKFWESSKQEDNELHAFFNKMAIFFEGWVKENVAFRSNRVKEKAKNEEERGTPECLTYLGLHSSTPTREVCKEEEEKKMSKKASEVNGAKWKIRLQQDKRKEEKGKDEEEKRKFVKPRVYECDYCCKFFLHRYVYRRHMIKHIHKNPRCLRCNKIFLSKRAKKSHGNSCRKF